MQSNFRDLNSIDISNADAPDEKQADFGTSSGEVSVYFKSLEGEILQKIAEAHVVVGCVAWLTSSPILDALAEIRGASIIVQKEDFLRPDIDNSGNWKSRLRAEYEAVTGMSRYDFSNNKVSGLSFASGPQMQAIRCVGSHNAKRASAMPRMHHKFLVFCRLVPYSSPEIVRVAGALEFGSEHLVPFPYAVWTGSYNMTANARQSLENAVYINNLKIALAYYYEWGQVLALSEPLDWSTDWIQPEYRIGT